VVFGIQLPHFSSGLRSSDYTKPEKLYLFNKRLANNVQHFHSVNMETKTAKESMGSNPSPEKLSSSKSIGFRPGVLRGQLDGLFSELAKNDTGLRLSDLVRDGLTAFWPQIEAYLRARQQTKLDPVELSKVTVVAAKALENGITAEELEGMISDLMEQKLVRFPDATEPLKFQP
jgi:hypothetical protein